MLRGRRSECEVLDRLLERLRAGRSGALVVRGEAGVGKTALLRYAIESASDLRIARAVGVESEMELAFAALHQLCGPLLDGLERLPAPQADALATAFGLRVGAVPDRFFVGLAVLSLLSEAAGEHPLLCVVDDAQWLDRASAQTLAFVARRLFAESVVLMFAAREPGEELRGLPDLVVQGLPDRYARELLSEVVRWPLDVRVREQILAETRGNPLALLELPRGLSPAQLAGGFGLPRALSLSGRIEESFLRRFEALPSETQRLLLLAAAESTGDPSLLWRAAERLGIGRTHWSRPRGPGCSRSATGCGFAIRWCARRSIGRRPLTSGRTCIACWRRSSIQRPNPIAAPGTALRRPWRPTRTSPRIWRAQRGGRGRAGDWRRRPHSSSGPSG